MATETVNIKKYEKFLRQKTKIDSGEHRYNTRELAFFRVIQHVQDGQFGESLKNIHTLCDVPKSVYVDTMNLLIDQNRIRDDHDEIVLFLIQESVHYSLAQDCSPDIQQIHKFQLSDFIIFVEQKTKHFAYDSRKDFSNFNFDIQLKNKYAKYDCIPFDKFEKFLCWFCLERDSFCKMADLSKNQLSEVYEGWFFKTFKTLKCDDEKLKELLLLYIEKNTEVPTTKSANKR